MVGDARSLLKKCGSNFKSRLARDGLQPLTGMHNNMIARREGNQEINGGIKTTLSNAGGHEPKTSDAYAH